MPIAFILWGICNIIMLIGICFIAFLLFKKLTWQLKYLLIGSLLTFAPVWSTIMMGELSFILTLSIVLGWLLLRKNEDFYGGLVLSLLLVKPHYIILPTIILVWKKPKAFLGLLVGAFALLIVSVFAVGLTGVLSYLRLLLSLSNWNEGNIIYPYIENSWYGLVYTYFHTIPSIGIGIYVFGVLITIGVLLYVWSGRIKNVSSFDLQWAILLLSMIFVGPHVNFHDLDIFIIVGFIIIKRDIYSTDIGKKDMLLLSLPFLGYIIFFVDEILLRNHIYLHLSVYLIIFTIFKLFLSNKKEINSYEVKI